MHAPPPLSLFSMPTTLSVSAPLLGHPRSSTQNMATLKRTRGKEIDFALRNPDVNCGSTEKRVWSEALAACGQGMES